MIVFIIATQRIQKTDKKELLSSLLENVDENKLGLKEAVTNANQPNEAIRIINKYELLLKRENKKMV